MPIEGSSKQTTIANFLSSSTPSSSSNSQKFRHDHPRQVAINDAVAKELIVGCSLPFNFVENPHFRKFMQILEPRYNLLFITF